MEEISGRIGTKTLDSLDKMTERSLRGAGFEPAPLGYEPTESGHELPLETTPPAIS
jgi:hypothetical protein